MKEIWSAMTCCRFDRVGDLSPKQSRVQRPGEESSALRLYSTATSRLRKARPSPRTPKPVSDAPPVFNCG